MKPKPIEGRRPAVEAKATFHIRIGDQGTPGRHVPLYARVRDGEGHVIVSSLHIADDLRANDLQTILGIEKDSSEDAGVNQAESNTETAVFFVESCFRRNIRTLQPQIRAIVGWPPPRPPPGRSKSRWRPAPPR